uniref:Uncharacterized protein n=1 Tax=Panagrolaimus sp. ES5 TaxID=591445 RepID=A0AC34FJW5_9BILA
MASENNNNQGKPNEKDPFRIDPSKLTKKRKQGPLSESRMLTKELQDQMMLDKLTRDAQEKKEKEAKSGAKSEAQPKPDQEEEEEKK